MKESALILVHVEAGANREGAAVVDQVVSVRHGHLPAVSASAYHWRITVSENARMNKKAWSIIGLAGLAVVAVVKAVLDKTAEKVVDQYYPSEGMGAFFSFLAGIPAWFIQPVGVPLLVLLVLLIALGASLGYIAWMIYSKRVDKEVLKSKLPAPKPALIVSDEQRLVLKVIADTTNAGVPLTIRTIFDFAGMDQLNFDNALNELQINRFIIPYDNFQKGRMLQLTPAGTKYILDENLAHKRIVKEFGAPR
ncbi:hypothetical protein [Pseudomonas sp. FP2294]|uniref:hypothetical protein n=1 Tax=Pseudomonas sp. FP2294 TaxID=2954089 RepID=UPI0027364A48|nr:hypothetical protein [Pseudomonas sp. FP2294]WLH55660.1 hypothetical protein PSH73_17235 [Pseudomonas sp. FP2294]